ncbi:hypothetical protein ACFL1R_09480 [Candidatus Latescibacterota bacterium]
MLSHQVEASQAVQEITKNIQGINTAASEMVTGANQTNTSAQKLSKMSVSLKVVVEQFKV